MLCDVMTATHESKSLLSSSVRCATERPNVDVLMAVCLHLRYESFNKASCATAVPLLSTLTDDVHRWRVYVLIVVLRMRPPLQGSLLS